MKLLKTKTNLAGGKQESQGSAGPESVFSGNRGCPNKKDGGEDGPPRDRETYYTGPVSTKSHSLAATSASLEVVLRGRYNPYYGYADNPELRRSKENRPQTVASDAHFGLAL